MAVESLKPRHARQRRKRTPLPKKTPKTSTASPVPRAGFFDLPREIRGKIYFETLCPDSSLIEYGCNCREHHDHADSWTGCTKLLSLNSEIYSESIELLRAHENIVDIRGRYRPLFRNPRDFGCPGVFQQGKSKTGCYMPARHTELQIMKLNKIALKIEFPPFARRIRPFECSYREAYRKEYEDRLSRLAKELQQFLRTVSKGRTLETLRLVLQRERTSNPLPTHDDDFQNAAHHDMRRVLREFLGLILARGIKISAEENKHFREGPTEYGDYLMNYRKDYEEPLVTWINNVIVPAASRYHFDFEYFINFNRPSEVQDFCDNYVTYDGINWQLNPVVVTERARFQKIFSQVGDAKTPYKLVPECRTCYELFETTEKLEVHLRLNPKHRRHFQRKLLNRIFCGEKERRVVCWTCGRGYSSVSKLDQHLDQNGHRRYGMIPRWKEDNRRWNAKAKARKEKYGKA